MIPKIIHYCWFGDEPIKEEYKTFIEEWSELNPSYTIKQWNNNNIPQGIPYIENAFLEKRWANLSNYIRLFALVKEGGIYLDIDIKLLKSLDTLLHYNCFLGFESGTPESHEYWVNNAIIGAIPNHPFIQQCESSLLKTYDGRERANLSAPYLTTGILKKKYNLKKYGEQLLHDVMLFGKDVFYPLPFDRAYDKNQLNKYITHKSICVHLWERSWFTPSELLERIDAQNKFIETHLDYIDKLENKLNSFPDSIKKEHDPYLFYRREMFTSFEKTLNNVQEHMNLIHDQLNVVQETTSDVKASVNNKPEETGIKFSINYLSGRLQEIETRFNNLYISNAITENNLKTTIVTLEKEVQCANNIKYDLETKITELETNLTKLTTVVTENSNLLDEITNEMALISTAELKSSLQQHEKNETTQEIQLNKTIDLNTKEMADNYEASLNILENKNHFLESQITEFENNLRTKADENQLLQFRLNSLTEYIDTSARTKQHLEERITLLENLIQKMRIKNRVKRIFGLYK